MEWAWKELDCEVRTKDAKVRVPDRSEGKVLIVDGKLCIPEDYEPPERPDDAEEDEADQEAGVRLGHPVKVRARLDRDVVVLRRGHRRRGGGGRGRGGLGCGGRGRGRFGCGRLGRGGP